MIEDELNVWFADKHVGSLWVNQDNIICFQYSDDWLSDKYAFHIFFSLPLMEEPLHKHRNQLHK